MEIIGYAFAFLIGVLLSLLGGGGSILTVPVLVYVFNLEPRYATAYSLLIVGISSLAGSINYFRQGLASFKTAVFFSFPSFVMVFIMRKYVVPSIPNIVFETEKFVIFKNTLTMTCFGILMLMASFSMIRSQINLTDNIEAIKKRINYPTIFMEGLVVGSLTGFVGVGGGFLIIPILTLFVNLPMKMAVGTSLMIIAINSCFGFLGDIGQFEIDWFFIAKFLSAALIGVLLGSFISKYIKNEQLKPTFGWITLATGTIILAKEIFF
ncbi:MAG: sulfite exporter TauE/SafE family protein [Cytophagales bacterium]